MSFFVLAKTTSNEIPNRPILYFVTYSAFAPVRLKYR
eukprot:COSAG06_NODE_4597_length_4113_cov_2.918037_2_plen_37_part_00